MNTIRSGIGSLAAAAMLMLATAAAAQQTAPATQPLPPRPSNKPDPLIQKIVSEISEQRITTVLKKLESFETRNTLSTPTDPKRGIGAARQWILDEFKTYSPKLEVSFDTHMIPPSGRITREVELRNVVAILPGKSELAKNRWVVISGHYDTVSLNSGQTGQAANDATAPGVCDDGSGTACVLECHRVMSQYDFDATLVFVALAGEEQGLVGARAMARRLKERNQEIVAVLNNDIIGTDTRGNGQKDDKRVLIYSEDPSDSPSRQIARYVHNTAKAYFPEFIAEMIFRYDRFGRGGDHTAFNGEGYTAVRITTPNEDFSHQHNATDTFANMSVPYTTKVTRINAASAASLALAPKAPVTMQQAANTAAGTARGRGRGTATAPATGPATAPATGPAAGGRAGGTRGAGGTGGAGGRGPQVGLTRTNGYDATLRWFYPDPEPDLAGFIIVTRLTTAPDWDKAKEIWVGNVRSYTMKDTPIDEIVLGVKAVDIQGHEGPVAAYINPPRADAANNAANQ